jgi:hypothetical protein
MGEQKEEIPVYDRKEQMRARRREGRGYFGVYHVLMPYNQTSRLQLLFLILLKSLLI